MNHRGHRLFIVASWGLVLVGVLHAIGHFAGRPTDAAALQVFAAMAGYRLQLPLGMAPSLLDVFRDLTLTMAVTLAGLGLQNLLVSRSATASAVVPRLAGTTALVVGMLLPLKAFYRVSPPLVLLAVVELLFLCAWLRLRAAAVSASAT